MSPSPAVQQLRELLQLVRTMPAATDNSERVDRLRLLEELKATASAAQLRTAVDFDVEVRANELSVAVPAARRGRGVATQLALALRRSPHATQRWLWHAKTLVADLPGVLDVLAAGRTTESRALLVAKESSVLSAQHRRCIDAAIAPELEGYSDRQAEGATRVLAQTLDAEAAVKRARRAASERCVSIRPVADSMARLSILTPMAEGVAAYAALARAADTSADTSGAAPGAEPRGRGQVMADTAIERLTGQSRAADVPVTVNVLIPVETLLAGPGEPGRDTAGQLAGPPGAGPFPIPAGVARDLALGGDAPRWLRRLFTAPGSGRLIQMETHRREFTAAMRHFIALRDQTCRTPWCDAPVRHADHIIQHARGGRTSVANGQGDCAGCNYATAAPGWRARAAPDGTVVTTTPTGHRYASPEPRPPSTSPIVERYRDVGPVELVYLTHRAA